MNSSRLLRQALGLIIGLGVQFSLGMWINLFVEFPDTHDIGKLWKFATSQPVIMVHIVLGTVLVVGALMLVVQAYKSRIRIWKICSGLGFGAILLAWLSGREFVSSQGDGYSLAMAGFFMLAILAYAAGLYLSERAKHEGGARG